MNLEAIIDHYVVLRDRIADIEARHKEELQPIKDDMQLIEAALLKHFLDTGTESMKTKAGTAYKTEAVSVKVRDWNDTLDRIRAQERWDLLEARVNKTAYMEGGEQWPGVEVTRALKVNVRRAT